MLKSKENTKKEDINKAFKHKMKYIKTHAKAFNQISCKISHEHLKEPLPTFFFCLRTNKLRNNVTQEIFIDSIFHAFLAKITSKKRQNDI